MGFQPFIDNKGVFYKLGLKGIDTNFKPNI